MTTTFDRPMADSLDAVLEAAAEVVSAVDPETVEHLPLRKALRSLRVAVLVAADRGIFDWDET